MKKYLLSVIVSASVLGSVAALAQSPPPCPGCEASPPGFVSTNPVEWTLLGVVIASASATSVAVPFDGICTYQYLPPPNSETLVCDMSWPCRFDIEISITVVDNWALGTIYFEWSNGGTICNVGHPTGGGNSVVSGGALTAFPFPGSLVRVNCNSGCQVDVSYEIKAEARPLSGPDVDLGTEIIDLLQDLHCDPCADC